MRRINRVTPGVPASAMRTFSFHAPLSTHWRKATCVEVDCPKHLNGWRTKVLEGDNGLGDRQAYYIRRESGRRFTEARTPDGWTVFTFEAGQRCFGSDEHRIRTGRPEIFVARGGDWRGNPTGERRVHTRPQDWVEDMADTLDGWRTRKERG